MSPTWLSAAGAALSIAAFLVAAGALLLAALFLVYAFSLWRPKHLAALVNVGLPEAFKTELSVFGQKLATSFSADEEGAERTLAAWEAIESLRKGYQILLERVDELERRHVTAGGADD